MKDEGNHIFSVFDELIPREQKEHLLKQRGVCLWFTGLSGSGKTTVAKALEQLLHKKGVYSMLLDGDNVRAGLNNNLGFSIEDRQENIRRIAEVAKLFCNNGTVTIACFVSPTEALRNIAAGILGEDFHLIHVNTPLEVCEARDTKGLYAKARKGEIDNFTGISSPFDTPAQPFMSVSTEDITPQEVAENIYATINSRIQI